MSHFSQMEYWLRELTDSDPELRAQADALHRTLEQRHRFNMEFILPIRSVEISFRNINDYVYGEDYTTEAVYTNDFDRPSCLFTSNAVEARQEELMEEIGAKKTKPRKKAALRRIHRGWEYALKNPEYDEILGNSIWRTTWREIVDVEIARKSGLGIVRLDNKNYADEMYLGFTCWGMDVAYQMMAYIALTHRVIDPEHQHYLTRVGDFELARSQLGTTTMIEILEALDVLEVAIITHLGNDKFTQAATSHFRKTRGKNPEKIASKDPAYPYLERIWANRR